MAHTTSPLRYPGGKSCLTPLIVEFLRENRLQHYDYAEPYAGGCGLALSLLYGGYVAEIHINDIDDGIWSFWDSILHHTDEFVDLIRNSNVSVEEWHRQRDIAARSTASENSLELGFATFFLNRTSRSGIIKGSGVIGGFDQKGNYKIDCRFNKDNLIARIRRIGRYASRIHLTKHDAIDFLKTTSLSLPERTFFCIDPPYFSKGKYLYTSFYTEDDHAEVARAIACLEHPWVVTYDDCPEIRTLYKMRRKYLFDIKYSVQTKRVGTELMVVSTGLRPPVGVREKPIA